MDVDHKSSDSASQKVSTPEVAVSKTSKTPSGKVLARQNQKRTMWKNALDNPFDISWNPIAVDTMQKVIGALSSLLKTMPTRTRTVEASAPKSEKQIFGEVVVGLNAVTRALEKDELRLVICTRDVSPSRIVKHIPVLCALRNVPLCPLNMSPQAIAELMGASGIKTVICMGIKRTKTANEWDPIVESISSNCPPIDVPWVSFADSSSTAPSAMTDTNPTKPSMKAQRQIELAKLKVKKTQHTAPNKPPINKPVAAPSRDSTKKPAAKITAKR